MHLRCVPVCFSAIPDEPRILAVLMEKKVELTPACRHVFDRDTKPTEAAKSDKRPAKRRSTKASPSKAKEKEKAKEKVARRTKNQS